MINLSILVQEIELTGENIVISKVGMQINHQSFDNSKIIINHHQNEGIVAVLNINYSYTAKNIIFRGTKIVDGSALGLIIETGNDFQIYRINNNNQKHQTNIQKLITNICITNLYFLLILASFLGLIIYEKSTQLNSYEQLWKIIRQMILLFNTMVALSLQFFLNTASVLLSKRIAQKNNVTINRNGFSSFQVNPYYIVSDKTGTLTTNELKIEKILTIENNNEKYYSQYIPSDPNIDILPNVWRVQKYNLIVRQLNY